MAGAFSLVVSLRDVNPRSGCGGVRARARVYSEHAATEKAEGRRPQGSLGHSCELPPLLNVLTFIVINAIMLLTFREKHSELLHLSVETYVHTRYFREKT